MARSDDDPACRRAAAHAAGSSASCSTASSMSTGPPIVATVAHRGEGIDELLDRVGQFREAQQVSGRWHARRVARARREVEGLLLARLHAELTLDPDAGLAELAQAVSRGELDAYAAAERMRPAR